MVAASLKLRNRFPKPKELIKETYDQSVTVEVCDCSVCKQAICLSSGVYCGKLREQVDNVASCPHFDFEPLEYRLYKRS